MILGSSLVGDGSVKTQVSVRTASPDLVIISGAAAAAGTGAEAEARAGAGAAAGAAAAAGTGKAAKEVFGAAFPTFFLLFGGGESLLSSAGLVAR